MKNSRRDLPGVITAGGTPTVYISRRDLPGVITAGETYPV